MVWVVVLMQLHEGLNSGEGDRYSQTSLDDGGEEVSDYIMGLSLTVVPPRDKGVLPTCQPEQSWQECPLQT